MSKYERWVAVGDSHGDMIDPDAHKAFMEFIKHWKPHHVIHAGDFVDLRALRRGASEDEANEGVKADIEAGISFVREIEAKTLLFGNHCHRIVREAKRGHGRLREYASLVLDGMLDRLKGVKIVPYGKRCGVFRLGDMNIVHGYSSGVYAARACAMNYGTGGVTQAMQFHVHSNSVFDMPTITPVVGYTTGCLCKLDMDYTESQPNTLRWSHGWAYGLLTPKGETVTWQAKKTLSGQWILPSELKTI